jgi:hypothetical protein
VNHLLLTVIADAPHNHGPDFGKASPLGLLVVVLLLIATLLLLRSMNRQLKKVPKTFDPEHPEPDQAANDGTDTVGEPPKEAPGQANGSRPAPGPGDEPG